jgi:hypothetical protein
MIRMDMNDWGEIRPISRLRLLWWPLRSRHFRSGSRNLLKRRPLCRLIFFGTRFQPVLHALSPKPSLFMRTPPNAAVRTRCRKSFHTRKTVKIFSCGERCAIFRGDFTSTSAPRIRPKILLLVHFTSGGGTASMLSRCRLISINCAMNGHGISPSRSQLAIERA